MNLSAPRIITFLVSFVLIGLAIASMYVRIPTIGAYVSAHRMGFLIAAYAVLAAGVIARGL